MNTSQVLQYEAQKALARRSFLDFVQFMDPDYRAEWYHRVIAEYLQRWACHEIPWLIITCPPRHGKTHLVSRYLPAWILGAVAPDTCIIASSGDQALTVDNSNDVRRIIDSDRYRELFGDVAIDGRNRLDIWETTLGGSYRARSTGSGLSGRGARHFFIDDYFSNQATADSPTERDRLWQWYNSDAKKRLQYPASMVVMATRWHHDDLIGRLLSSPEADRFEVIHIPKVNDWPSGEQPSWDPRAPGEPLLGPFARAPHEFFEGEEIPERFAKTHRIVSREEVMARVLADYEVDRATNAHAVSALDQGRPTPRGGSLFRADWIQTYPQKPQDIYERADAVTISIDPAFKTGAQNDPTSILVAARLDGRIYLLDAVVKRMAFPDLVEETKRVMERYPRASLLIEDAAAGQSLIQLLRRHFPRVVAFKPSKYGNKQQRAQYAADFYAGASVFHPQRQYAPWLEAFELELMQFPQATHDDQVDALAQLCVVWSHGSDAKQRLAKVLRLFRR